MAREVDNLIKQISRLSVSELQELIKKLGSGIGNPPEPETRGAIPKKPKPTLSGGVATIPPVEKKELISVISTKIGGK